MRFNYFEPFFGSGSVYFHLKNNYNIKNAYLNDNLQELIYFYKHLKDTNVAKFYEQLQKESARYNLKKSYDSKTKIFLERSKYNELITVKDFTKLKNSEISNMATLFILLNQSCFLMEYIGKILVVNLMFHTEEVIRKVLISLINLICLI